MKPSKLRKVPMRKLLVATTFGLWMWGANAATQAPTTATFIVSASVNSGCLVVGSPSQTSGVGFGMLDFGTQPAVLTGNFSASLTANGGSLAQIQCTPGISVTVTLDGGLYATGSQRRMRLAPNYYLPYTLTTAASGGTTINPGVGIPVVAGSTALTLPVYGSASSPGTGLPGGQYSDTVQVTFSW